MCQGYFDAAPKNVYTDTKGKTYARYLLRESKRQYTSARTTITSFILISIADGSKMFFDAGQSFGIFLNRAQVFFKTVYRL